MSQVSGRPPSPDRALDSMASAHAGRSKARMVPAGSRSCRGRGFPWLPGPRGGVGGVYSRGGSLGLGSPGSQHPEVGGALRLFGLLDWGVVLWVSRSAMRGRRLPVLRSQNVGGGEPRGCSRARGRRRRALPQVAVGLHRSSARGAAAGVQRSGRPSAGERGVAAQTKRC